MCAKTMFLGNYAKWIDMLVHIHIAMMGKSVSGYHVSVSVGQWVNHITTSPLLQF